jgi:hypothetical protein
LKIDIDYYPLKAKNPNPGQIYGEVHSSATKFEVNLPDYSVQSYAKLFQPSSAAPKYRLQKVLNL